MISENCQNLRQICWFYVRFTKNALENLMEMKCILNENLASLCFHSVSIFRLQDSKVAEAMKKFPENVKRVAFSNLPMQFLQAIVEGFSEKKNLT